MHIYVNIRNLLDDLQSSIFTTFAEFHIKFSVPTLLSNTASHKHN